MRSLKPSARENKRYLKIRGKDLKQSVEKAILEFGGVLGLSQCGLSFIECKNDSAIICINREAVDKVRASLCVWPEKISVERASGTLKGLGRK